MAHDPGLVPLQPTRYWPRLQESQFAQAPGLLPVQEPGWMYWPAMQPEVGQVAVFGHVVHVDPHKWQDFTR